MAIATAIPGSIAPLEVNCNKPIKFGGLAKKKRPMRPVRHRPDLVTRFTTAAPTALSERRTPFSSRRACRAGPSFLARARGDRRVKVHTTGPSAERGLFFGGCLWRVSGRWCCGAREELERSSRGGRGRCRWTGGSGTCSCTGSTGGARPRCRTVRGAATREPQMVWGEVAIPRQEREKESGGKFRALVFSKSQRGMPRLTFFYL